VVPLKEEPLKCYLNLGFKNNQSRPKEKKTQQFSDSISAEVHVQQLWIFSAFDFSAV
jgi:hypothetical protein